MVSKKASHHKAKSEDHSLFGEIKKEMEGGEAVQGLVVRPMIQMVAFASFIIAMFLLLIGDLRWGGSAIIFSFVVNLGSIYQSLSDDPSIYRTMNLVFKFILFTAEVVAFNWILLVL